MGLARRVRRARYSLSIRTALALFLLALSFPLLLQAATYTYDAGGRLRSVTSSSGESSQYVYDALGNILAIDRIPAGQLAIATFVPNHGPVGSSVTIYGQGFSSTPSANGITFNGVAAAVTAATSTQLTVTVPTGATTGPIAATVGTASTTSLDNFIVTADSGGLPPIVTAFSPQLAAAGTTITVTGSHFVATPGSTYAGIGNNTAVVVPSNDTQLAFAVPATAGSGPVAVSTPYGTGMSSQALIVVPPAVGLANVLASGNLVVGGAAQPLNITTAGKYGVLAMQGVAGQWISLQCPSLASGTLVWINVYDGVGNLVTATPLQLSTNGLSAHLPQLPRTGTYTLTLQSNIAANFSIAAELNPTLTQSSALNVSTTVPWQSKRIVFAGVYQQYLGVSVSGIATVPAGNYLYGTINNTNYPEGYNYQQAYSTSAFTVYAPTQPTSAPDTLVLDPRVNATFSAQVSLVSYATGNPSGSTAVDGAGAIITTGAPDEYASVTFSGVAGQNLSLGIADLVATPSNYVNFTVFKPDGNPWDTNNPSVQCVAPGCHYLLTNLPQTGTYKVWVSPSTAGSTLSFKAVVSSDVAATLSLNTAYNLNLAQRGQVARLTFAGTTGQYLGLSLQSVATVPTGGNVYIAAFNPDGTAMNGGSTQTTSGTFLNLPALKQTGTYLLQIESQYADSASAQLTVVPNPSATLIVDGASVNTGTTSNGQYEYLSFAGTAGQQLSLAFSSLSSTPAGYGFNYTIYQPNGSYLSSATVQVACSTSGCHLALPALPATGNYSIVVQPAAAARVNFTATLSSDVTGALVAGTALPVSLAKPGQVARLTFTGAVGDQWAVNLGGVSTTPTGGSMSLQVYKPDGNAIGSSVLTASTYTVNLPALTQAGTYTVQVEPPNASTATAQVTIARNPKDTVTLDGAAVAENPTLAGEAVYLSFAGTAGQTVSLVLSNFAQNPGGSSATFYVYKPDGTYLTTGYCSPPGCHTTLVNLPSTGTYSVTVNPPNGYTAMSFSASLTSVVTGALTVNTASLVSMTKPGQPAVLTFPATAGSSGGIYLAGLSLTPSGGSLVLTTYKPDGTLLQYGSGTQSSSNGTFSLPIFPVTGTYSLLLDPPNAATTSVNVTVLTPTALTVNGSAVNVPTTGQGQSSYFSFAGTAAQNATFVLSNLVNSPSGGANYVAVYQPNGTRIAFTNCYGPGCSLALTNLPATGVYQITVQSPGASVTTSLTAKVTSP